MARAGISGHAIMPTSCESLTIWLAITDLKDCEGVKDFHELKGERKGTFSMHVTGNYCITFKWDGTDVYDVEFEDYH